MKRRRFLLGAAALASYTQIESAQARMRFSLMGGIVPSPQATAFLVRANAVTPLSPIYRNAYIALINGLVSAGIWTKLDILYMFAAPSSGVALLNLVSSSFTSTVVGTMNFQPNYGFTNGAGNNGITSNFNATTAPSPKFTQNSAHLANWNSGIGTETPPQVFADTALQITVTYNEFTTSSTFMRLNDAVSSVAISTVPNGEGFYLSSRSGAIRTGYWNGNSLGTANSSASAPPANASINFIGVSSSGSSSKLAKMGSAGAALSGSDATKYYSLLTAYFAAITPVVATSITTAGINSADKHNVQILTSTDGINFSAPAGVTNPIYSIPAGGGIGTTSFSVGANIMFSRGKYWMCYEMNDFSGAQKTFGISSAPALNGPWTWVTDVTVITAPTGSQYVWNPHWFVDDDGSVHIYGYYGNGSVSLASTPFIVDCLDTTTFASWSAAATMTGTMTAFPNNFGDFFILSPNNNPTGLYALWYRNLTNGFFELATSSSRASGYNTLVQSNPFRFSANGTEGITPIKLNPNLWRIYFYPTGIGNGWQYIDSIDNWATYLSVENTSLFAGNIITTGPMSIGPT